MPVGTYALTTLANLKTWLGISAATDDAVLEQAIDRATARIESYTSRLLKARNIAEWRSGCGTSALRLHQFPAISITNVWTGSYAALVVSSSDSTDIRASVSVRQEGGASSVLLTRTTSAGVTTSTTIAEATYPTTSAVQAQIAGTTGFACTLGKNMRTIQLRPRAGGDTRSNPQSVTLYAADIASEYTYDSDSGMLYVDRSAFEYWEDGPGSLPSGAKSVLIEYRAGYEDVPADLEQACIEIAAAMYRDRKRDSGLQSESLGDYTYTRAASAEMDSAMKRLLADFRDVQ